MKIERRIKMKGSNHLEDLIKDNWESIKDCRNPMDQVMLSVDMVYQNELKNCKPNEKVQIKIKQENGNIVIHGKCVPK